MVKVYFETKTHAELIAIFDNEDAYMACIDALKLYAKKHRGFITESIEEQDINELS